MAARPTPGRTSRNPKHRYRGIPYIEKYTRHRTTSQLEVCSWGRGLHLNRYLRSAGPTRSRACQFIPKTGHGLDLQCRCDDRKVGFLSRPSASSLVSSGESDARHSYTRSFTPVLLKAILVKGTGLSSVSTETRHGSSCCQPSLQHVAIPVMWNIPSVTSCSQSRA